MTKHSAVIDRIANQIAVILVGDDEQEYNVPVENLPDGAKESDWLLVEIKGGDVINAELNIEATEQAKSRIQSKLERLRQRGGGI